MLQEHPRWCNGQHPADEPHQSFAFDVEANGAALIVSLIQAADAEPQIVFETITDAGPKPSQTFSPAEAEQLSNVLFELHCALRLCDCWKSEPMCPGNVGFTGYTA